MDSFRFGMIIFTALFFSSMFTWAAKDLPQPSKEFIRKSCNYTRFPNICRKALLPYAGHVPLTTKYLVKVVLKMSSSSSKSTIKAMKKVIRGKQIYGLQLQASKDCLELLDDARDNLKGSISRLHLYKKGDFNLLIGDVKTWTSAALTDYDTCADGFSDDRPNGKLKILVEKKIADNAKLISIALGLINVYASES